MVSEGRTASGRTFAETTALPKNAKYKYEDFLEKYHSIMNEDDTEGKKVEKLLSARKDAYIARNYYEQNAQSMDKSNGDGYSAGILKSLDDSISEMDAYQSRILQKGQAERKAEADRLYNIQKRREEALASLKATETSQPTVTDTQNNENNGVSVPTDIPSTKADKLKYQPMETGKTVESEQEYRKRISDSASETAIAQLKADADTKIAQTPSNSVENARFSMMPGTQKKSIEQGLLEKIKSGEAVPVSSIPAPSFSVATPEQTTVKDNRTALEKLDDSRRSMVATGENIVGGIGEAAKWAGNTAVDYGKAAYDMAVAPFTGKTFAEMDQENAGKKGVGALEAAGVGLLGIPAAFNNTVYGLASNYIDWTHRLGKVLGLNGGDWNPAKAANAASNEVYTRLSKNLTENGTSAEKVAANVIAMGGNSALMMYMGYGLSGAVGSVMGGGVNTVNSALQASQIENAASMAQMAPFALQSGSEAYSKVIDNGGNLLQASVAGITGTIMSLATNSKAYEEYTERMGLGVATNASVMAKATGLSMTANWGDAAFQWAKNAFGSMGVAEGLQEVSESLALKLNDDMFSGSVFDSGKWQAWGEQARQEFIYGYLSGALFYATALPAYAPSKLDMDAMITGEKETTPETIADFIVQVDKDVHTEENKPVVEDVINTLNEAENVAESSKEASESIIPDASGSSAVPEQGTDVLMQAAQQAILSEDHTALQEQDTVPVADNADAMISSVKTEKVPATATEDDNKTLMETASVLGKNGDAFISMYKKQRDIKYITPEEYSLAYMRAFSTGKKKGSVATADDLPLISEAFAQAYLAGMDDADTEKPAQPDVTAKADAESGYTGLTPEQTSRIRDALSNPNYNSPFLDQVKADADRISNPTTPNIVVGRKGKSAYAKWQANEYVNIIPGTGDPREVKFKQFFEKYYTAGKSNTPETKIPFDETVDTEFPAFLQTEFYRAGKEDALPKQDKGVSAKGKTISEKNTVSEQKAASPSAALSDTLLTKWISKGTAFNSSVLFDQADKAFGGTQAEGVYTPKDAYDAMELAVNKHLLTMATAMNGDGVASAKTALNRLENLLSKLPTQTKRSAEQESFQQFSTPPNIAYLAARVANITSADSVLEPSAGIGGLAVFAKAWGADVAVNELSKRRLAILKEMGFNKTFNENAEQIDNVLPDDVKPTVVLMNPPFSSTAGRTSKNSTHNAETHVEQALRRLEDGGRLVAVLGKGMADDAPAFSGWWKSIRQKYAVRANIGIDGSNYTKYGTGWGVQIVVIDKTGPQGSASTVTGTYKDLIEAAAALEGVRDERDIQANSRIQQNTVVAASKASAGQPDGNGTVSDTGYNASVTGVGEGRVQGRVSAREQRGNGNALRDVRGTELDNLVDTGAVTETSIQSDNGRGTGLRGTRDGRRDEAATGSNQKDAIASQYGGSQSELSLRPDTEQAQRVAPVSEDGVYAEYSPAQLPVTGAKKHPAPLVESAAMAAVQTPKATYVPNLPAKVVKDGLLSGAQLENVVYSGQAHQQMLPDGKRKGYFIGDGTGVGKGRQISGIILDNFRQGRTKAVWVSKNIDLLTDAQRDWVDIGGNETDFIPQGKIKLKESIQAKSGILFTQYGTLRSKKDNLSRLQQIVDWLGTDFDGVIAFDEVHTMGNLLGKKGARGASKGSAVAEAGSKLQDMLPNARVVYVSATGATDVDELSFASRLGLWGEGTAFKSLNEFVEKIGASGLSAMELVARDMKAAGSYLARSISYNGVEYDTLQHNLTPVQREIYNSMSEAWQITLQNLNNALAITNQAKDGNARGRAKSAYFGAMQRFYNQILTSMGMPSVIEDIKKQLAQGNSCVLQIVNTNAAELERQLSKVNADEEGGDLDDLDLTPRGTLIDYLMKSFPTTVFQEVEDDNGKKRYVPVIKNGEPLVDKEAVRIRDAMIEQINQMRIPDGPLEMLFDAFGEEQVAEATGRQRRVVSKTDDSGKTIRVEQPRSKRSVAADVDAFQGGRKHILVFSDAGGTGKSYHADLRAKNQEKRIHYLVQPGWSASKAVQGFGRTHRSNQKQPPLFKLVTTDVMGQKRFVSTIARRLDQLGALTKGQRETGGGMFTAKDNLESPLARDSLRLFYERLGGGKIKEINGKSIFEKMGLYDKFYDEYGRFRAPEEESRDMNTFLNRILALAVDEQNTLFNEFFSVFEGAYDTALQNGTLDMGMETVKADKIELVDDQVVRTDPNSGAETHYVQAKISRKPTVIRDIATLQKLRDNFIGIYRTSDGKVRAVYRVADKTNSRGEVSRAYKIQSPTFTKFGTWQQDTLDQNATEIPRNEWAGAWAKEVSEQPEYDETTMHLLTGTLLPVWNLLPEQGSTKAIRIVTSDGKQYLGREIGEKQIDATLTRLGAPGRTKIEYKASDLYDRILKKGDTVRLYNDKLKFKRSRVNNEQRIEITGDNLWYYRRTNPEIIFERIGYQDRYFLPTTDVGKNIIERIIKGNPVEDVSADVENLISTDPSKQNIKSSATSINASKLPALYGRVQFAPDTTNLDIGGGRFDNVTDFLAGQGVKNYIYDPYNRSAEHNRASAAATQEGQSDTVTCSNVLNVIREQAARDEVILNAVDALKLDGTAYFTVYEGDGSGTSAETTKGWQENRLTSSYLPEIRKYFTDVAIKNKVIIAKGPKKAKVEHFVSSPMLNTGGTDSWQSARAGGDRTVEGIDAILRKARQKFGLPIISGHIRGNQIRGQYNQQSVSIRTKITNDLPAASHEIGHYLNAKFKVLKEMSLDSKNELLRSLDPQIKAAFQDNPNQMLSEAFAEYIRKYMQNRETAQIDFPGTTLHMTRTVDEATLKTVNELADDINAYYSLGADTAQPEIMTREEAARDHDTLKNKLTGFKDRLYLAWVDANAGIRKFDKAAGSKAYKLASNSAYSEAVAGQAIVGELRGMDGNVVSGGLQKALSGVDVGNKKEYAAFGEYLIVKHGPERLSEGMRVFANDMKNSTAWMERRRAELEQEYPAFAAAAERLYAFQKSFLQSWGVDTGLVSADAAKTWENRWKYYVPFSRVMDADASAIGARRGYANQDSTIRKARGSGRSFIHPVDNIITNITRMVNAAMRNRVMLEMVNASENTEGMGAFMEPVPAPLKRTTIDLAPIKGKLVESAVENGVENADAFMQLIENFDDVAYQYEQGKAHGDVITVLRGGKQEFFKVNDPLLLQSLVNMSPKQANAVLEGFGRVTRFVTSNITGRNVVWSIFSNLPRDVGTYMTFSKDKNPLHLIGGVASAYLNKFKGDNASDLYREYLAMGGGKTSAYTADKNLQKNIRKEFSGDKLHWLNPLEWLDFISDMVESGPRYATYKIMRERYGMDPQEAFYESSDITVNFRRGGVVSRQVNKIIPFFNASVQGIDKFGRWLSAEEVAPLQRKKTAALRAAGFTFASIAIAALIHGINSGDDDKKKQYAQLSAYTKNGYYCIPIGGGKYFAIPKPREIATLTSLFERMLEYYGNDNKDAFTGFYSYAAETMLPNAVSGIAQLDLNDSLSSLGLFGVFNAINANKDFLGRPIESMSMSKLEPKERFTQRTSKAAKAIGDWLNVSPIMTDYALQNLFGGFWKWNQALFPIGDENIDYTLGVKRNYIKDSLYSNDSTDELYTNAEAAQQKYSSGDANGDQSVAYKLLYAGTNFYSNYQKLSRNEPETDETRSKRQMVLDMVSGLNRMAKDGVYTTEAKALAAFVEKNGGTEQYPTAIDPAVKDASGVVHQLTSSQYADFTADYLGRYWNYISMALSNSRTANEEGLRVAKNKARAEANANILAEIGAESSEAAEISAYRNAGVTSEQAYKFSAEKALASADGAFTREELLSILDQMQVGDAQKRYFYSEGNPNATITSNPYTPISDLNQYLLTADPGKSKESITATYKDLIVQSYTSGNTGEFNRLSGKLYSLELYDKKGLPYYTPEMVDEWINEYLEKLTP